MMILKRFPLKMYLQKYVYASLLEKQHSEKIMDWWSEHVDLSLGFASPPPPVPKKRTFYKAFYSFFIYKMS